MSSQQINRLTAIFNTAMSKALAAEEKDDWAAHLKALSNAFTQVCTLSAIEESAKKLAIKERDAALENLVELKTKADSYDDVLQQLHLLLAADNQRNHADVTSHQIFENMCAEVNTNMERIRDNRFIEAKYKVEKRKNDRMMMHINELSKKSVMHLMATRFYARELAALRQMMDLVRNSATIQAAVKSKLWDDIEKENQLLRFSSLRLINRINSSDLYDAPFESGDNWHSPPRVVVLMREHINQGLGLEITGGCCQFRPVVVTGKLKRSMADDDQLLLNDRILAIDGTFVTNTTTHAEVMEMLENECSKDFITLLVSQFHPIKYQNGHAHPLKSGHQLKTATSTTSRCSTSSGAASSSSASTMTTSDV